MKRAYDTIIIGAGVAGLACARKLLQEKKKVLVLEARARTGGRIHTVSHLGSPVELGPEFVHGAQPFFTKIFEEAKIPIVDVLNARFYLQNGKLTEKVHLMDQIKEVTARLNGDLKKDRSVQAFLDQRGSRLKKDMKTLVASYIENFHACELHKVSEKALARVEQDDEGALNDKELFRPAKGYSSLINKWLREMGDPSRWLQLESLVQKIEWSRGEALVIGRPFAPLKTKTVVLTVPLGVLKSGNPLSQVRFDPQPQGLNDALSGLEVGHVERITFEFKSRFWEDLHKKTIGFMQSSGPDYFPVWWTQAPSRTPFLIAWQGGIRAREIAAMPKDKQIAVALKTLSKLTKRSPAALKKMVKAVHLHNWDSDPYCLGAYSYVSVGGLPKAKRLTKPFSDTLFFAGEATAENSMMGTVHGALSSGERAARQVLNTL